MKIKEKIPYFVGLSLIAAPLIANGISNGISNRAPIAKTDSFTAKSSLRRLAAQTASAPVLVPRGQYVGELQEKWQFPSDHLPIGMSWNGLHIASWNVMNSEYFSWIENNSQGLSRSLIAKEHQYLGNSRLTIRDAHNIELILEMLEIPNYSRALLSLQECSAPFLEELDRRLPPHIKVVRDSRVLKKDQNAILYDTRILELIEAKRVTGIFSEELERSVQDLLFERKSDQALLRILNAHVPGNPAGPARYEFTDYLARTESKNIATIGMGDMNFNELEMQDALKTAYARTTHSYKLLHSYCTNINPYSFNSKSIDHFLVNLPIKNPQIDRAENVLAGLEKIVDLLEEK